MSVLKAELNDFIKIYHQKYQHKIHELTGNRPWYFRVADYFLGLNKLLKNHQVLISDSISNKKGVCACLKEMEQDLMFYSLQLNVFTRWLLGIKPLIHQYSTLLGAAMVERDEHMHQADRQSRVSLTKDQGKRISFTPATDPEEKCQKTLKEHVQHKQNYLNNLPKFETKPMPYVFEIYGTKRDIVAKPSIYAGKLMTYKNLKNELKATHASIASARDEMVRKRKEANYLNWVLMRAGMYTHPQVDPGEAADKRVDGGNTAVGYLERQLKTLQFQSPTITIEKDDEDYPTIRLS